MPIHDIFSKRQKALRGEVPDVYIYDSLPRQLRVQIVYIMRDALGHEIYYKKHYLVKGFYDEIVKILCREHGAFQLPENYDIQKNKGQNLLDFFLQEEDIRKALDVVELAFSTIDRYGRDRNLVAEMNDWLGGDHIIDADSAIEELNERFKEHGVGYRFTNGRIVRIDSELIHSEVVQPALRILNQKQYAGAQQEFLQAHEHYRAGNTKETLNECLKSLESVMKSICDKRGWGYGGRATASTLIKICFDKQLIPPFWRTQYSALRGLLESVPVARNDLSSHGQGPKVKEVPDFVAGYVLHMTAAAIVFLAQAEAGGGGA